MQSSGKLKVQNNKNSLVFLNTFSYFLNIKKMQFFELNISENYSCANFFSCKQCSDDISADTAAVNFYMFFDTQKKELLHCATIYTAW